MATTTIMNGAYSLAYEIKVILISLAEIALRTKARGVYNAIRRKAVPFPDRALICFFNIHACIVGFQDVGVAFAGFRHAVRAGLAHAHAVAVTSA